MKIQIFIDLDGKNANAIFNYRKISKIFSVNNVCTNFHVLFHAIVDIVNIPHDLLPYNYTTFVAGSVKVVMLVVVHRSLAEGDGEAEGKSAWAAGF